MNISIPQEQQHFKQLQQLCPLQCSIAFCLNQLRDAQIQFLNLGNFIICPEYNCLIIFKYKILIRIDKFTNKQQS